MTSKVAINYISIKQWLAERLEMSQVKERLIALGHNEESVNTHIKEFLKLKNGKRQFNGFILVGVGSFLGFVSCVITMMDAIPSLTTFCLYGLTSFAILVTLAGLYLVFE